LRDDEYLPSRAASSSAKCLALLPGESVCVDAVYYDFPRGEYLEGLAEQVPNDFRFGLKVTDAITIKRFPYFARFGNRAGQSNPDFLNAKKPAKPAPR
jgi:uncharacterized protein YecE (DUF72 family)